MEEEVKNVVSEMSKISLKDNCDSKLENLFKQIELSLESKDFHLFEHLLQLYLVYTEARTAYFLESQNNDCNIKKELKILRPLIEELGLKTKDYDFVFNKNRPFFIHKHPIPKINSDSDMAHILGMIYDKPDFFNFTRRRMVIEIFEKTYSKIFFVEVSVKGKIEEEDFRDHALSLVRKWNEALKMHNLPFQFDYNLRYDEGMIFQYKKINEKDFQYFMDNKQDYLINLLNFGSIENIKIYGQLVSHISKGLEVPEILLDEILKIFRDIIKKFIFDNEIETDDESDLDYNQEILDVLGSTDDQEN